MIKYAAGLAMALISSAALADDVTADDLIVQGSFCVGFDCVSNAAFGFDTILLRENNTRIRFDDTSTSGSFPKTDWQLTANDSANGGRERFSIEDVSENLEIFTITGGAPAYSLYVGDSGDVGIGTDAPQRALHVRKDNSPTLRLEQSGDGGFTPATWDIRADDGALHVALNGIQRLSLDADGNLTVSGSVTTTGVTEAEVPDYVFADNYPLMPLRELGNFVSRNRHLPEVPSAGIIARDGMDLSDLQLRLLRKVEELTLYTLQQQKQIESLQEQLHAGRRQ
ncbi:hypothetical protein [Kineobactrum salinum]|uniref:Uncharacterized protein n=1 Tax=Kineobactrum salinum TaxID=2708301 RepID=A0A6C0U1C7_9GAMM|nr:hypothetical protein [Kineobactrum salinum]QIB65359.1 hypothetical protein G3T16_08055 [Kineobactrum salinum]